jgi:hypothetical protein
MIEAMARYNQAEFADDPGRAEAATLSALRDAHTHYVGFGDTGEFTLARRQGNRIVFVLSHRHFDLDKPAPVSFGAEIAEPMRRALSGRSGTVIGMKSADIAKAMSHFGQVDSKPDAGTTVTVFFPTDRVRRSRPALSS